MNASEMKRRIKMKTENAGNDKGGREKGWNVLGNGGGGWLEGGLKGVLWGVIEFLSSPALSGLRLSVWLSVLGAERQVKAWKDSLTSSRTHRRCSQDAWQVFPGAHELKLRQGPGKFMHVRVSRGVLQLQS